MAEKQSIIFTIGIIVVFFISGCSSIGQVTKEKDVKRAWLGWYAYYDRDTSKEKELKAEYQKKIEQYLQSHKDIKREIADNMKCCNVILGMTEEQVSLMAEPHEILDGKKVNEKIFKYSDLGKLKWGGKYLFEGIKVFITFTDGVVSDIDELSTFMGF